MSRTGEELPQLEAAEAEVAVSVAVVTPSGDEVARPVRVWNLNFVLLWTGQLISALGDVVYGIALGFWVLQKTGSTALMGSLMAASTLPRILLSPFAGVLVDRTDRRQTLILTDALRGAAVLVIAALAYADRLDTWMVFAAGIVISAASAFFFPAVGSTLPDIVPKQNLVKANSAFSMLQTGSGILGNAAGGFLYQVLGAPLMFLANGVSYLVAAVAEVPMRIPRIRHESATFNFIADLKSGFGFVWRYRGIRYIILIAAVLNFFAVMGFMLFLPMFERTPGLGAAKYGIVMAGLTGGMFAGYLLTSLINIAPGRRFLVFYLSGIVSMGVAILIPAWLSFPFMLGVAVILGIANAVLNSLLSAILGIVVPQEMRGEVFSLLGTVSGGLTPIAFALGGVLAEAIPIRLLIAAAFALTLLSFLPTALSAALRRLVGFNPGVNTLEEIR